MAKKVYYLIFLVTLITILIWVLLSLTNKEILPVNSNLPAIKYKSSKAIQNLEAIDRPLIIIYFSTDCEYCVYELNAFDKHISEFDEVDIYFFTSEKQFFANNLKNNWKELANASNVNFGIVSKKDFSKNFGSTITPMFFFFSDEGILIKKIKGELKIEKVLEITKNLKSGRAQSSGNN